MRLGLLKLGLPPPTIARSLIVGLVSTIAVVFAMTATVNYLYSWTRDTRALNDKSREIVDDLASILISPLWNLDLQELNKVVDIYRRSGIVADIKLTDDAGRDLITRRPRQLSAVFELSRAIYHDGKQIGTVVVAFSNADIVAYHHQTAVYSAIVFAVITLAMIIACWLLLRHFLAKPFASMKDGLTRISSGDYLHRMPPVRQTDINDVTDKIMIMAAEIAKREKALLDNRQKLEILNQAILDIFSCSDVPGLIRVVIKLANKVCGTYRSGFLADSSAVTSDELRPKSLPPLLCVDDQTFATTEADINGAFSSLTNDLSWRFPLQGPQRPIGTMFFQFDTTPDPSQTSLLKSLMSLTTLAVIRQSFIQESALIAAELQVAETVQRSLLLDDRRQFRQCAVAYHYEPAQRVGGDWFTAIEGADGSSLYVILGDVTGHGLAQGLVTATMAGAMSIIEDSIRHPVAGAAHLPPSQIVSELNGVLARLAGKSQLRMTCVAARLDLRALTLEVCNAGHTFPLLLTRQAGVNFKIEPLTKDQQPILGSDHGDQPPPRYRDVTYRMGRDHLLIFYTDGLTEALNRNGQPFARGFYRQLGAIESNLDVQHLRDRLLQAFRSHTSEAQIRDDVCLLLVEPHINAVVARPA